MKKKIAALVLMLPVPAMLAAIGLYRLQMHETHVQLNAFVDHYKAAKLVTVDFAVVVPTDTPKDQIIYLSGSVPALGNWDAAGLPLERKEDGLWHATADVQTGINYQFKLTRGTWGTVETDTKGVTLPDRSLKVTGPGTINVTVADWLDHGQTVPGRVTTVGEIRLIKKFHSKILDNERTLAIYLPAGYNTKTDQRYPVLYAQDGQNLFDESTSFAGVEWGMDEAAQKLIGDGEVIPFIIVGIYNTPARTSEYTPPILAIGGNAADGSPAHGEQYAQFLVQELKPYMDQTYRTQSDRAHTLVGGAALGGTISMYAAKAHSDVFGQIVALSPWLRQQDHKMVSDWAGDGKWLKNERIYADMGTDPVENPPNYPGGPSAAVQDGQELASALTAAGLQPDKDFLYRQIPGGKHDERSWHSEIESVLKWVFAKNPQDKSE